MKRLLYPLIASALITITPFLATFEYGQNIVRGLFGYEVFSLLLLFITTKAKAKSKAVFSTKGMVLRALVLIIATGIFAISWIDLQNLLAIKGWNTSWYGILPFITCGIALAMVWKLPPFNFSGIGFILFITLIGHLAVINKYAAQPIAQFPIIDYCERIAPQPVQRKHIANEYQKKYTITDSVSITRDYTDSNRNNVIILVESWGVPLDITRFSTELTHLKGIPQTSGIHNRMYSRTRTAEREDLMHHYTVDSLRFRDTTFLPKIFAKMGYKTTFLFGGDSLEHQRFKYINKIGFGQAIYGNRLNDSTIANKIDSILADTTQKHFIAWTTRDTKFPMKGFPGIYNSDANAIDSAYSHRLGQTLSLIAELARKHPDTRFIVQGDHNPILSPITFQELFYKRWVPFIILN